MLQRLYFSPGMFGFGQLASYDYFEHVERELATRLRAAGHEAVTYVLDVPPTASIRRRAVRLAELVSHTFEGDEGDSIVHLIGHSTGGLDARLVASPSVSLAVDKGKMAWLERLGSVTMMNTPHFGTPLATFFATVSGQRMLHALSALTFVALSFGAPPLAAASALVVTLGRLDRALGIELALFDKATDAVLRVLDDTRSKEVRFYLDAIKKDQGSVIQLTPEAMDLYQAGIEDRPGVVYQSTCSMAPPPSPTSILKTLIRGPWSAVSAPIFTTLYGITARFDERYPCAAADAGAQVEAALASAFGRIPGARSNDGVVPIRSQLWGDLIWAGYADHLDVLGHFKATRDRPAVGGPTHRDWLASGAHFDEKAFGGLMDAIAGGIIKATAARSNAT